MEGTNIDSAILAKLVGLDIELEGARKVFPLQSIKLTRQEQSGKLKTWKKTIGHTIGEEGRPVTRVHQLGLDYLRALYRAQFLLAGWELISRPRRVSGSLTEYRPTSGYGWTPAEEQRLRQLADNAYSRHVEGENKIIEKATQIQQARRELPTQPRAAKSEPAAAPSAATNLYGAIDAYNAAFAARPLSGTHRKRTRELMEELKLYRPDTPLVAIDRVWLAPRGAGCCGCARRRSSWEPRLNCGRARAPVDCRATR